jgi:hypothetical protein
MKCTKLLCAALAVLCWTTSVQAAIIVNDTWIDGTDDDPASPVYSENGLDTDADGDIESAWFQGGDGTLNPVGTGGPLRGQFSSPTSGSSASWTSYFTAEGSELNLANDGDSIKVTWVFSVSGINASNTSQNFRLAVVNTPSPVRLAANGAPAGGAYTGYGMFMNMAPTLGNSNPFRLMERAVANGALLGTSGDWAPLGNGAATGNAGYANGVNYTYEMSLTRNGAGIDIVSTMTGGNLNNAGFATVSVTDASPDGFLFDTFSIRPSGATTTAEIFNTSLFKVEFTPVPEPTSLGLLGLSALAMAFRRRR